MEIAPLLTVMLLTYLPSTVLGLPRPAALLPDGDLVVVYYAGENGDQTNIRWARLTR